MQIRTNKNETKNVAINILNINDIQKSKIKIERIHHIHILDRSGSMYRNINSLIDNVIETIEMIRDDDLVSIIWFASSGENSIFLKGCRKSDIKPTMFDKLRSTLGCTCFSEPIGLAKNVISDLKEICPHFSVNLFTDGHAVVNWSDKEEERRCVELIKQFKDDCIAFNTIGYGSGYNFEFLRNLSNCTDYGTTIHSSEISEYKDIFEVNFNKISDLTIVDYEFTLAKGNELLYIADGFVKHYTNTVNFKSLSENENIFITITPYGIISNPENEKYYGIQSIYAYAYILYYNGFRKESLNVIRYNLYDKALIDSALNSFTIEQTGEHLNYLRNCIFDSSYRFKDGKCDEDYRAAGDYSVIDLFADLISMDAEYYPYSKLVDSYKRTTRARIDNFNMFNMPEDLSSVSVNMSKLVLHKTRLNVSILFAINGTVNINPKQAKEVGIDPIIPASIFRTHSFISDGNLHMEKIHVKIPIKYYSMYNEIISKHVDKVDKVENTEEYINLIFNLTKFPIISNNIAEKTSASDLLKLVENINFNEGATKVFKYLLEEKSVKVTQKPSQYNEEQLKILEQHGIKNGIYSGIDNSEKTVDNLDVYYVKSLKTYIKGLSSVPSVNAVLGKINKKSKLNIIEQYIAALITAYEKYSIEDLEILYSGAKRDLLKTRMKLAEIKLFTVLTGDWIDGLVLTEDNKEYRYNECDQTLIVSPELTKEYI